MQGQSGTLETSTSGAGSTSVAHALLPGGATYVALQEGDLQLTAPTPTSQPGSSASGSATATLHLQDPGIATSATTGKAKHYVDLAPVRDCAAGTLSADWTKKTGAKKRVVVTKAVFYADGVKVGEERRPDRKTTTTLKGLDPTKAVEITTKLTRVEKGRGKLEVSRSYLPCS